MFFETAPPLSQGLGDRPPKPPPPFSEGLDQPLLSMFDCFKTPLRVPSKDQQWEKKSYFLATGYIHKLEVQSSLITEPRSSPMKNYGN